MNHQSCSLGSSFGCNAKNSDWFWFPVVGLFVCLTIPTFQPHPPQPLYYHAPALLLVCSIAAETHLLNENLDRNTIPIYSWPLQ
mmetsp:Transcript_21649/g.33118  ORF Transcript_21649/g.33118 Transcript_21649/m.33118 type:complete len:84 (-) Transcript_21649:93-344(-)